MQMVIAREGGRAFVRLAGRLDGEWAEHLSGALDEFLRDGMRSVILDMADVTYLSSAGTKVLARGYEDFSSLRGELRIADPSATVLNALKMVGLDERLLYEPATDASTVAPTRSSALMHRMGDFTREDWRSPLAPHANGHYEISSRDPAARLSCQLYGDPRLLRQHPYEGKHCSLVSFPDTVFGLGLGALADRPEETLPRIGELMAVGGVVAYLPTDGALVADYQIGTRSIPPKASLVYGLACQGTFSHLVRFHTQPDATAVPLSELASLCLETVGGATAGMVVATETAGLVGAALRRPPSASPKPVLTFEPSVSDWLSFTPEPTYQNMTALLVGVVSNDPPPALEPYLRPLGGIIKSKIKGHFHAVVFPYEPLPQRTVAMQALVLRLFGELKVRSLLHLVSDDRGQAGAGESELLRGLCWTGRIGTVKEPGA
ncbi:MAG TPA: STAS domain-containing protein [Gemmatimonadales bacterium]|jgi:anti-anti-sigma factor|nr:STAS domain-containing protein [Gemmatimonadales bacterium]